jgi:multidrug efflux pump subunit AcrA (membrane-fusion protein)
MRLRIVALAALPVVLIGLTLGCNRGSTKPGNGDPKAPEPGPGEDPAKITTVLYPPVAAPATSPVITRTPPIVISQAIVQFDQRQVISAEVDGTIEIFATHIKEGEKVDPSRVVYHPRDLEKKVPLRRLSEGDDVADGQILAFLDDQQISARIKGTKEMKASAETALKFAIEGADQAEARVKITKKAFDSGTGSFTELIDAQLTLSRFRENEANARQTIAKNTADLAEATVLLDRHRIKSRVNGVIRSIAKRPGEFVKAGEKIMEIEATDLVRIEGQLDVQYAPFVHRGMEVVVEPAVASAPIAQHKNHRLPVTGLAVTSHADGPLVVSVSTDGSVLVWDPNLGKKQNRPTVPHNLPHPVGVRSVAATPPAAKVMLAITGADDGKIRVWDVANRDKLPTAPKAEASDVHTSAVQAIAVSPDGQFFATAAGRDVFIWDLATAKKRYALPAEHRDVITAVNFTPQNTLVTASKDGTLKVWKLGADRAAVLRTIDHRAGAVEVLGVSRDGGRVLFDQDKGRLDLVDPANAQTIGQIENVGSAGSFSTLAIFGPDEVVPNLPVDQQPYSIATAGGDGDLKGTVQYWLAPRTGGRGAEVGRLITPGRAPVTAAAFSPVRGEQFLVVGTSVGGVHLWKPSLDVRQTRGRIVNIDPTDTRYVTVRVEMDNKVLKLLDHSTATVIIPTNP